MDEVFAFVDQLHDQMAQLIDSRSGKKGPEWPAHEVAKHVRRELSKAFPAPKKSTAGE